MKIKERIIVKIIALRAENIKRLSCVEVKPGDRSLVEVVGKNGQGKSSVLDAIWVALGGAEAFPEVPIRRGETEAQVFLDLGDLRVTRKLRLRDDQQMTTSLRVENPDGAFYSSPQKVLDALVGKLAFDPLEFLRLDDKKRYQTLLELTGNATRFEQLDWQDSETLERRKDLNREVRRLELAKEKRETFPEELPREMLDTAQLVAELEKITASNNQLIRDKADYNRVREEQSNEMARLIYKIKQLQTEIDQCRQRHDILIATYESSGRVFPETADVTELRAKIQGADQVNQKIRLRDSYLKEDQEIFQARNQLSDLNLALEETRAQRSQALESLNLPVQGLSLVDGKVLLNDLPLAQASTAEQLRLSCGLAALANPKLNVVFIKRDGSLLDEDNLLLLAQLAEEKGLQIWVERLTSGTGNPAIELREGEAYGQ